MQILEYRLEMITPTTIAAGILELEEILLAIVLLLNKCSKTLGLYLSKIAFERSFVSD